MAGDTIKIVTTAELTSLSLYGTLSYCWGPDKFTMLTSANLSSFHINIPAEELPATFNDGVNISRRLGLDFIWIDALCIIQDDYADWLRESTRMASVYGGSYVNITASSARSVYEGCFFESASHNNGLLATVKTSEGSRVQSFYASNIYESSTTKTHLASRAWAFQEKLLAPRTIHFGNQGLFWECRSSIASESLPEANCIRNIQGKKFVVPED